jgi:hypothetical protein
MKCAICEIECPEEICGWCQERLNQFKESNKNHSCINIAWGCGKIAWGDAYFLRDFIRENNIKEVLEFGTGLSTEIFAILGLKIVTCDTLKNHLELASKLQSLNGLADFIYYEELPDFEKLYPGKKWEFVFVDGGQGRDRETEIALTLSSKFIYLHDPGLSKYQLELPGFKRVGGSYLFKKI